MAIGTLSKLAYVLCESSDCMEAAKLGMGHSQMIELRQIAMQDRFYALLGIIVESLFLLVLLGCMAVILFVWKVGRDALMYVALLGMLVVSGWFVCCLLFVCCFCYCCCT